MKAVARIALAAGLIAAEASLWYAYDRYGAGFHHLVHGLLGAGSGLVALVALRLGGRATGVPPWAAASAGRVLAAVPDMLFLSLDLPHARWMDVFVAHIAVHFVPAALAVVLGAFALAVAACAAVLLGRRRLAGGAAALAVAVVAVGLAARDPIPSSLAELRARPEYACVLPALTGPTGAGPAGAG